MSNEFVNDVVSEMQQDEINEFKSKISNKIRYISDVQKDINSLKIKLETAKKEFRELKLEATNYADLIV